MIVFYNNISLKNSYLAKFYTKCWENLRTNRYNTPLTKIITILQNPNDIIFNNRKNSEIKHASKQTTIKQSGINENRYEHEHDAYLNGEFSEARDRYIYIMKNTFRLYNITLQCFAINSIESL